MTLLRPCSSCQRHVTVDETRCPFCSAALDKPTIRYVGRLPRMTRSALFAVSAAMVASCGSEVTVYEDDGGSSNASSGSSSSGNVGGMGGEMNVDLYGAPGTGGFEPGTGGGGGAEQGEGGEGGAVPLYGAAPDP